MHYNLTDPGVLSSEVVVVMALGDLIKRTAEGLAEEYRAPRFSPDASDDYMKDANKKLATLRKMREDFESLMAGVV